MQMTFGRMSEPLTKVQKVDTTKTAQSYDFMYKYEDSNHPTAPTQIGHEHYTYDANGNPTLVENDSLGTERRMYWDEHTSSEEMPYKFNGKELDQETGQYYYGARYMNPVTNLWYGVDALTEKYPTIGGYVYCVGNLIKFVDLDGKDIFPVLFQTINNRGRIIESQYRSNKKYMMAMRMFGQTSYGRQFKSEQKKYEKVFGN